MNKENQIENFYELPKKKMKNIFGYLIEEFGKAKLIEGPPRKLKDPPGVGLKAFLISEEIKTSKKKK